MTLLVLIGGVSVSAANYTFRIAARSTSGPEGQFSALGTPSINARGEIAFWALLPGGIEAIYREAAGSLTEIVRTDPAKIRALDRWPVIATDGAVAYRAELRSGSPLRRVYLWTGSESSTVDGSNWVYLGDLGSQQLSIPPDDSSRVSFLGTDLTTSQTAIVSGQVEGVIPITSPAAPPQSFAESGIAYSAGRVAFSGSGQTSAEPPLTLSGLWRAEAGGLPQLIVSNTALETVSEFFALDAAGNIYYVSQVNPAMTGKVVRNGPEGLKLLAETSTPGFTMFGNIAVSPSGRFAFQAAVSHQTMGTPQGIFTGGDPLTNRVLINGDTLVPGNELVGSLQMGRHAINENSLIAFWAAPLSGGQAVVVASPAAAELDARIESISLLNPSGEIRLEILGKANTEYVISRTNPLDNVDWVPISPVRKATGQLEIWTAPMSEPNQTQFYRLESPR